jgi:FolB domain-containing protein
MTDEPVAPFMDEIHICDLRFRCIVGVDPEERRAAQEIVAQIMLYVDLRKAGRTDAMEDTVNYASVKKDILALAEGSRFHLVEALAQAIADACLKHSRVQRVAVVVDKPAALSSTRTVGVRIVRDRAG